MKNPDPASVADDTWAALGALFATDAYAARLGATIEAWSPGTATVSFTPDTTSLNFGGGVHGGAIFSLADIAFSIACNGWGRVAVALQVDIRLVAPVIAGTGLTATCVERTRRRQMGAYDVSVVDAGGELVATASALAFRTAAWHLGEAAWPENWRAAV